MQLPKEDFQTNTIEGAAAFEQRRSATHDHDEDDTPSMADLEDENEDGDYSEHEDYCGCSDPGCPCSGSKRGSL